MEVKVLDHGYVKLIESWGSDRSVVNSARVSIEGGARDSSNAKQDKHLINYLAREMHTSPFEHCGATFYVKAPFFVLRQWHRHRTQSYNEVSGRYSSDIYQDCYMPSIDRLMTEQTKDSRQGSGRIENSEDAQQAHRYLQILNDNAMATYKSCIGLNATKELSRLALPMSTYSEMYATTNFLNWARFISLRNDNHAQYEIRVYADAVYNMLKEIFPNAIDAFFPSEKVSLRNNKDNNEVDLFVAPLRNKASLTREEAFELGNRLIELSKEG